jgi:hypothetical protein
MKPRRKKLNVKAGLNRGKALTDALNWQKDEAR